MELKIERERVKVDLTISSSDLKLYWKWPTDQAFIIVGGREIIYLPVSIKNNLPVCVNGGRWRTCTHRHHSQRPTAKLKIKRSISIRFHNRHGSIRHSSIIISYHIQTADFHSVVSCP